MSTQLLRLILITTPLLLSSTVGADSLDRSSESRPLSEDERRQITLDLLERYPQLASSPGIKAAAAPSVETPGSSVGISVIFFPHADHHGVKEAFEADCGREYPVKLWTCEAVEIRRYLRLASQDFEVRLKGDITSDAAFALIEASRKDLSANTSDVSSIPDTVIMIMPHADATYAVQENAYRITWGTPEGHSKVTMLAELEDGGDPVSPDDWRASPLQPQVPAGAVLRSER